MLAKLEALLECGGSLHGADLVRAFIATLSREHASSLVLPSLDVSYEIRRPLIQRVAEDIRTAPRRGDISVIETLFERVDTVDGRAREKVGYVLKSLCVEFPKDARLEYSWRLATAKWRPIRRRGYKIFPLPLSENDCERLIANSLRLEDIDGLRLAIKEAPTQCLMVNFDNLNGATKSDFSRRRLFLRCAESNKELIELLREEEPITYTYLKTKLAMPFTDEEAIKIWKAMTPCENDGLLIWCFGKMGLTNALKYIVSDTEHYQIRYMSNLGMN
jgi:hypothetical protein